MEFYKAERDLIEHFYNVAITEDEVYKYVDMFKYYNVEVMAAELKDLKDVGSVLLLCRLFGLKTVISYSECHSVKARECYLDLMSRWIDSNNKIIFGSRCVEEWDLFHVSTDLIYDSLAELGQI